MHPGKLRSRNRTMQSVTENIILQDLGDVPTEWDRRSATHGRANGESAKNGKHLCSCWVRSIAKDDYNGWY